MYHDEFAPRSVPRHHRVEAAISRVAFEVVGGVSVATASAIVLPDLPVLLSLGGVLPMLACCFGILMDRCSEIQAEISRHLQIWTLGNREPRASIGDRPSPALRGTRFAVQRSRTVRAGFDRSRRLG